MSDLPTVAQLSDLDRAAFVGRLGALFEHSPWVAERAWEKRPFDGRAGLLSAFAEVLAAAGYDLQKALIDAHPELAGKAAVRGELTADSAREQAGAGLNACSPAEFAEIQRLNAAYRAKFGWPFIVAVKGLSRTDIIAEMARRLERTAEQEFAEAQRQILRIVDFRLGDLIAGD